MRLLAGASGYSFKEWKGSFYPADIRPEQMLAWYAGRLPTVEINNTFYRMPKPEVLQNWAHATPDRFRFAIAGPLPSSSCLKNTYASRQFCCFKRLDQTFSSASL